MKRRQVNTVFRKGLLDTLRDKRTLLMMIGIPVVLYPALMIFGLQFAMVQQTKLEESTSIVAVIGEEAALVLDWLEDIERVEFAEPEDPDAALASGEIDALVLAPPDLREQLDGGGAAKIEVFYDSAEFKSREALDRIADRIREKSREYRSQRLASQGLDEDFISPLGVERTDTAPAKKTTGTVLGMLLPLIVVVMIIMGAFYPAIDLTAGEKERGTFETLLSTPLTTTEIVAGKFLAVFSLALFTGLLNIGSMGLTTLFLLHQVADTVEANNAFPLEVPYGALAAGVLVLIPLALLISAIMMGVAVLARSFKEAQNLMTPILLVLMLPAGLAAMPTAEINNFNQFIPVFNVVLLFKELLRDKAGLDAVFAVVLSTAVYAVLALQMAVWLFQREEVVLSEERGLPLSFRRKEFLPRESLPPGVTMGFFSLMLILLFYAGGPLQQWKLLPGLFLTEWVVLLAPTLLLLWYVRVDLRKALHIAPLKPGYALGAAMMGVSAIVLLIQIGTWHNKVLPMPSGMEEAMEVLFAGGDTWQGFLLILGIVALSPAICEEVLFRGAILSGLRRHMRGWQAALLVGFLFGLFHLSIYRILPTGLLGVVLTYLVLRSGSIFAGILVHFINNGLAVLIMTEHIPERVFVRIEEAETAGLPVWVLAAAATIFIAGIAIVEATHRRCSRPAQDKKTPVHGGA